MAADDTPTTAAHDALPARSYAARSGGIGAKIRSAGELMTGEPAATPRAARTAAARRTGVPIMGAPVTTDKAARVCPCERTGPDRAGGPVSTGRAASAENA